MRMCKVKFVCASSKHDINPVMMTTSETYSVLHGDVIRHVGALYVVLLLPSQSLALLTRPYITAVHMFLAQ